MEHLTQEELLLLADGELADERAAHLDACTVCCAAAGEMQGQLTAITAQLRAGAPVESPESHSASWVRLEDAIRGESDVLSTHLSPEELLLHLDEELAPERALHVESCEDCHDEWLRVQALMFDIEHELRALIPAESPQRRMAAAAALEQALYPAREKVVSFPLRWGAVYAAAAALVFAVFGGLWLNQNAAPVDEPAVVAEATPPASILPELRLPPVAAPAPASERPLVLGSQVVDADAPSLERFQLAAKQPAAAPQLDAVDFESSPSIKPSPARSLTLAWSAPEVPAFEPAPEPAAPRPPAADDPAALIAALSAAVRSGAWERNIAAESRAGQLVFAGAVASARERETLIAAVRRELPGREIAFDIAVRPRPSAPRARAVYAAGDRAAGGMMRSALLTHYADAARRSFQQPTPSALEAEIARFASEVYRSQSTLVRHAHALSAVLGSVEAESLSPEAANSLAALVRFHSNGVAESEAKIYDHLSEALPRRYWNHRGDRDAPAEADAGAAARGLLSDALKLDETLTVLLSSSAGSVDAAEIGTSPGGLLYRIRTRARNLTSALDSAR